MDLYTHPLRLRADASRVVVRPFNLAWQAAGADPTRVQRLIRRVIALDQRTVRAELGLLYKDFERRHWQTRKVFTQRFDEIAVRFCPALGIDPASLSPLMRELLGAYFCHEYSYAAAALMNPSITPHPDQSGLSEGSVRFVMSLRAVGEGHISSIAFREGIVEPNRTLSLLPEPPHATAADASYIQADCEDCGVTIYRHPDSNLSGTVIFPVTDTQSNGLEDLRLTRFVNASGAMEWAGTYTAYDGRSIRSELLRTTDFRSFTMLPMTGAAARNKGMALFPSIEDGRYRMIGRQDGENLFLLESNDITHWDEGVKLLEPRYPWEFIQIGNCGPPIELDGGWLLLTHGVGAMRKYSLGAVLLDKQDPSKILGRLRQPLLSAADEDRDGYVPNVVYTCGAMQVGPDLFIPYGVADSSVAFAFVGLRSLLDMLV